MDRSREARRAATIVTSNGLPRRRHRTSSLRDSPEDDGPLELQEPARLRDRTGKKDNRDRDRDRDRLERDRTSRAKRRRGDKYLHGTAHRDDAGEGTSDDESVNEDEEEDPDDSPLRYASQQSNPLTGSTTSSSSPYSTLNNHRRSYPPPAKLQRAPPPTWKPADDVMGVSVPRKARSASTKRSHDCWTSGVHVEAIHRQASASPVRPPNMNSGCSSAPPPPPPMSMSPSSPSISIKKKIKSNGTKPKPPKSASKPPSLTQDDIEIEVAEVLYGLMRQSHDPPKQDPMSNESASRSAPESKPATAIVSSSPGSNSAQSSAAAAQSLCSSQPHFSVVAPKRKRPRTVSQPEEIPTPTFSSSGSKVEPDLVAKPEAPSPAAVKNTDSEVPSCEGLVKTCEDIPEQLLKAEKDDRTVVVLQASHGQVAVTAKPEEQTFSPMIESTIDSATSESIPATGCKDNRRVEKFEIDLMAPPPQSRLSPETLDAEHPDQPLHERLAIDSQAEPPPKCKKPVEDDDALGKGNDDTNGTERKADSTFQEGESHNRNTESRNLDLKFNVEVIDGAGPSNKSAATEKSPRRDDDRTGQSSSVALSMPVPATWPAGLPPMGYVAPLQGVVSMDGGAAAVAPAAVQQPPSFIFTQPRPRRCGYHCYIAKNIQNHQQFTKNYPFWPTPTTGNPLYGAKPYNLNIVPSADLHTSSPGSRVGVPCSGQDKGQALAFFPGQPASKDKSGPSTTNVIDGAQKKQFFLPQSLPPGAPSNILQGPAFLFPMGQQQQAAANNNNNSSARTNPASKSSNNAVSTATSATSSNPALNVSATATTGQAPPPAMSFNFPNMPLNETQYLAILGNSPYPFPIPAHVTTAPPPYRGPHPQAMPFFNGSFYPSQIIHPSQLQQQQQHQQQPIHQNPSISSASSSSQKQMQNHQQRPQGSSGNNVGNTNQSLHPSFPAPKSRAALHAQQQHEMMGGEDSPSTADSRASSRPVHNMGGVYGPNFNLPFNPPNFALLAPQAASTSGPANGSSNSNNFSDKKHQQPTTTQTQQHAGQKSGLEPSLGPQAFAMSFASLNGPTTSGLDFSSMAQNHAILQSLPEPARHTYQIMTAAAAAQQKNAATYRGAAEDGKASDSSIVDDQRKTHGTNNNNNNNNNNNRITTSTSSLGQSITFSRPGLVDSSVSNNVLDSSARSGGNHHGPPGGTTRSSRSSTSNAPPTVSEQQQFLQLQKQQQFAAAAAAAASRSKNPPTSSNGSVYPDHQHLPSAPSTAAAKFPNALSGGLYHGGSPVQSPQWKASGRAAPPPSQAGATTAPLKTLSQQQTSRNPQQGQQTQISFSGGNHLKPSSAPPSQSQGGATGSQTESLPLRVGSPTTSSLSKGAGGSPRTNTSSSTGNKQQGPPQVSVLSPQAGSKSSSHCLPSQKSSSLAGGRNSPSLLGNPHTSSSSVGSKSHQLQQQPQLSKQSIQQAQLFFSSPYMQQVSSHTPTSAGQPTPGGFYLQRHRPDQQHQHPQQHGKSQVTSCSSGMVSLCPPNSDVGTSDPAKAMAAAAAAAANMKGQGILHAAQFAASQAAGGTGFPYVHAVSAAATAVQGKQAEQKQPAGEYLNR